MIKFSLVVATLNRDIEIKRLFESLKRQDYRNFEIIIVDQNKDNRVKNIIEEFQNELDIKHFKVEFTGVARARDYGIEQTTGEIVAFPDDDCFYADNVLSLVVKKFNDSPELGIISSASYDIENPYKFSIGANSPTPVTITKTRLMGIEFTFFFNLRVIKKEDFYLDSKFGLGGVYKSTEGFELLYRLLYQGYKGEYDPEIKIYHKARIDYEVLDRIFINSYGEGAFIRKFLNKLDCGILYHLLRKMLAAPVAKFLKSIITLDRKLFARTIYNTNGIWQGFWRYSS